MSTLEQRVAALEKQMESLAADEALSVNYLTVDPDTGQVSASFSGVVSAHGFKFYDDTYGFVYSLTSARPASGQPVWQIIGPLWSHVKQVGLTWAQIKALGSSSASWSAFRNYVINKLGL